MNQRTSANTYPLSKKRTSMIWAGMSLPLTILTALMVILLTYAVPSACLAAGSQALTESIPAGSQTLAKSLPAGSQALAKSLPAGSQALAKSIPAGFRALAQRITAYTESAKEAVSPAADTSADPISLTSCQITLSRDTYTYNGKAHTPSAKISYEGTSLRKDRDFTVTYAGNIEAGTSRIIITGAGQYTDTISLPFTILPRKMAASYITLSASSLTYEGKALTPAFTVTYQSLQRTAGKDFTYVYQDNINAGTAQLLVTGKGNFTGTAVKKFKINKAGQVLDVKAASDHLITGQTTSLSVTGYQGKLRITSSASGTAKVTGTAAEKTGSPASCTVLAKKAGTVQLKVRAYATDNYKSATAYLPLTIEKCSLELCKASLSKEVYTYNGSAKKPSIQIFNPYSTDMKLTKNSGYTVTYKNCTTIGTASAVIKGTGSYTGTITLTYMIQPPRTSLYKPQYKDKNLTLKWRKITGITGYQISISTSPDFNKQEVLTVHSPSTVSASKSGLKEGGTYYLRIRTYKTVSGKNYYSAWSKEKTLTI